MASLVTHALVPLLARAVVAVPRRCVAAAVVCACLPDLDVLGQLVDIREGALLGQRNFSHSILFAALLSLAVGAVFLRSLALGSRAWWRAVAFVFFAAASHGLLDAISVGDTGVALFAPFGGRYFLPWRVLPACPISWADDAVRWTRLVAANEVLYVLLPASLCVLLARSLLVDRRARTARLAFVALILWMPLVAVLREEDPDLFVVRRPRVIVAADPGGPQDPALIPTASLPDAELVTRFDRLRAMGLFDRELVPDPARVALWSSGFFPALLGSEAGRWQDGRARLVARSLFGASPPTPDEIERWTRGAASGDAGARNRLFRLSPTEKLDLLDGDLSFEQTRATLASTHNGSPRYWYGRCNGISSAAIFRPEPFRVVDAIGRDGRVVRFHPYDIKALLAVAYYAKRDTILLGGRCDLMRFDAGQTCSMNPASLVIASLNWIGRARQSFLLDALPSLASQYYPVARALVRVVGEPRPVRDEEIEPALRPRVASLVDVEMVFTLSSTTLPEWASDVLDPSSDGTRYARVGLRPVVMAYPATLALDASSSLVGGRWTGDPANGPDHVVFVQDRPVTREDGVTLAAPEILSLPIIMALAQASIDERADVPTVDVRPFLTRP